MSLSRRSFAESSANLQAQAPQAGYWVGLPDTVAFMQQQTWPDGSSRQPGTLMLFAEAGLWKCWLHDRDAGQGCFLTGRTLDQLLEKVEEAVASGGGDWRADRPQGKGKRG